ncbi:hypothetical protein PGN35_008430 [Nodosilinea sp. PGN35]
MGSFPVAGESRLQLGITGKGTDPPKWTDGLRVREADRILRGLTWK